MAKITGSIEPKKKKKPLKEELSDLVIDIKYTEDTIIFNFNKILKPYQRNRLGGYGNHLYDPLNSYKTYIQKAIKKVLDGNFKMIPNDYMIFIETNIFKRPPESFSIMKKYYCLNDKIRPISKPDNDNFEKTIFDIMNKLIWNDDSQIVESTCKKYYRINDGTYIKISYKKLPECNGRVKKEFIQDEIDKGKLPIDIFNFLFKKR